MEKQGSVSCEKACLLLRPHLLGVLPVPPELVEVAGGGGELADVGSICHPDHLVRVGVEPVEPALPPALKEMTRPLSDAACTPLSLVAQ